MGNRTRPPPVSGPCLGALAAHPPRGIGSTVPARPPLGSSSGSPLWSDPRGMRPLAFRTRFSTRLASTLRGVPYPFGAHRRGGLPPVVVPRPPAGGNPRGKPVRAFLGAHRRRVRAPRGVRGPPRSHSPSYSPGLPLSLRPGGLLGGIFAGASGGCPPYAAGYSNPPHPWLRPAPPGGLRTGREVPALGRRKPGQRPVARFPPLPVG